MILDDVMSQNELTTHVLNLFLGLPCCPAQKGHPWSADQPTSILEKHCHKSSMEAPVRLALPPARGCHQTQHSRLPQDHQAPHGFRDYQKETGEQLLLVRQGMHQRLQHCLHQLLRVQQSGGRHCCHGSDPGKVISY